MRWDVMCGASQPSCLPATTYSDEGERGHPATQPAMRRARGMAWHDMTWHEMRWEEGEGEREGMMRMDGWGLDGAWHDMAWDAMGRGRGRGREGMVRMDGWGLDGAWVAAWGACGSGCKYLAEGGSRRCRTHAVGKGKGSAADSPPACVVVVRRGELVVLGGVWWERADLP